jgi:hypothetical protein
MEVHDMNKRKKISTRIWRPLVEKLDKKIEAACLRRDLYLSRVLRVEIPYLDEEITKANSPAANTYIAGQLDTLERKLVTLSLEADLVDQLEDVCSRKNINRDSFFNRLILLLCVSPKLIDILFFEGDPSWRTEVWSERKHDGPFFQNIFHPLDQDIDPFWAIRTGLEQCSLHPETVDTNNLIYTSYIPSMGETNLVGMNTYLPDYLIPGHPSEVAAAKELDELLGIGEPK